MYHVTRNKKVEDKITRSLSHTTRYTHRAGFTLTEILITMALLGFIASLGVGIGIGTYRTQIFGAQVSTLTGLLQAARNRAMNNLYQSEHGVRVEPDSFVLFYGSVENEIPRSTLVTLGGLDEVVFEQLSGETDDDGEITLAHEGRSATIEIRGNGRIEWSYD